MSSPPRLPNALLRVPDAVLRDQQTSSGTVANREKRAPRQQMVAADGALIPVIYGEQRVGAKVFALAIADEILWLGCLWCAGPVEDIVSIDINDTTYTFPTGYRYDYPGSVTQGVDTILSQVIPGYSDTLVMAVDGQSVPLAYSVLGVKPSRDADYSGFPRISAVIQGRKVYDPRTSTTVYSRNPALCLADWITNAVFGQGLTVDWTSVDAAADACDETLSDASKRRELDLVIDSDLPVAQWTDVLRTYAGCFVGHDGANVVLIPDRPGASSRSIDASDIVENSLRLSRLPTQDRPTVVEVAYTDTTTSPWRDAKVAAKSAGVDSGTVVRRLETVTLPGITRRAQAYREAVERLNASELTDLSASWATFDEGLQDMVGDILSVTHPIGLSSQLMRLTDVQLAEPGRWNVSAVAYDSAVYSDSISPPTGGGYTELPDPSAIPSLSGLTAASGTSYLLKTSDGTILSRMAVSWTEPTFQYVLRIEVQYKRQADTVWTAAGSVAETSALVGPVEDGTTYDIRARIINTLGQVGAWTSASHLVVGKTEPPPDVDSFNVSVYGDGTRYFSWALATPPADLAGYQVRYVSGASGTWGSMSALHTGLLNASPLESNALAAGEWTFAIKAVDTSGNESTNANYITVTLGDPRLAGVLELIDVFDDGWSGTKTNGWVDTVTGWLMATDSKTWASLATDGVTWATWVDWARDANDLTYTHGAIDVGIITTFTPLVSAVAPEGTLLIEERYHNTDIASGTWATAASAPITARYYQARAKVSGSAGAQLRLEAMNIILNADPLEEVIEDLNTSTLSVTYRSAAGNIRLPITESFAQIRSVFITLQNVGAGWSWELIDKDTTVGPNIKIYNSSNTLADATIDALIRGL